MEKIYYLENIIKNTDSNASKLILFDASLYYDEYFENQEIAGDEWGKFFSTEDLKEKINFHTGFITQRNNTWESANSSKVAKHFIMQNTIYRQNLKKKISESVDDISFLNDKVYSYHINVGMGNCSLVYSNGKITCIDCSTFDFLNHQNYSQHIDICIDYMKKKFELTDFHIDNFILTHPHFDHYSGISYLISKSYITEKTNIYLNTYYSLQSPSYNRLLKSIDSLGCKIIDPIIRNSKTSLKFLYPKVNIIKKRGNVIPKGKNIIVDDNPNNASCVIEMKSNNTTFIFPGDLETEGWDRMNICNFCNVVPDYFALSHHGSINGFLRKKCHYGNSISDISDCISQNLITLIMGRAGAYNNVPHQIVLNKFPKTIFSEINKNGFPKSFLEIEWSSKKLAWY